MKKFVIVFTFAIATMMSGCALKTATLDLNTCTQDGTSIICGIKYDKTNN